MEKYAMARDVAWGLAAIAAGTLVAWWLLARFAKRMRRHFEALLSLAQDSLDAPHDVAVVRARMTALRLLLNAGKYVLVISAILMVLRRVGVQLDALLLPAGFLGAALGLGAQNLVRDVVAGLFLVLEGQFAVGDVVGINGTIGTVDEIGLRVTRLRDEASHIHFFPNGAINAVEKYPREPFVLLLRVPLDPRFLIDMNGSTPGAALKNPVAANSPAATASIAKSDHAPVKPSLAGNEDAKGILSQDAPSFSLSDARALVLSAIHRFDNDYHVLEGEISQVANTSRRSAVVAPALSEAEMPMQAAIPEHESNFQTRHGDGRDDDSDEGSEKNPAGEAREESKGDEATVCFQLPVRALRIALVREKLPPRLLSMLEANGLKVRPGTEVGLFGTPHAQNETA